MTPEAAVQNLKRGEPHFYSRLQVEAQLAATSIRHLNL